MVYALNKRKNGIERLDTVFAFGPFYLLKFIGYTTYKTSQSLGVHRRITNPVVLVREVIHFRRDTELPLIVESRCIQDRVGG